MFGEWSGAAVRGGGGKPASTAWEPVSVPGRPAAFAGEDRVAYRTVFADPRDPGDATALVELRGCYATACVWLNDEHVAESDVYFEPIRVPFEPEAENELVVECRAPEDRFGGVHDTDRVPESEAVPGIWWGAELTTHPASFVVGVDARPDADGDEAAIDAAVEVYAGEPLDERVTLTTRPAGERAGRGMMERVSVGSMGGERVTVETRIEVRDPSPWWPREMGAQNRYEIRAKLDDDVTSATTGFATVTETDDGLAVNGHPIPVRGVTLQDGTVADVERAVEVNANLVRAHAHALPDAVYEACDEAGLLVWQDLPLTGAGTFDISRGEEIAERLARTRGHHPSLAAFGVHDEPTRTFADRLGGGVLDRLRLRWRVWRTDYDPVPAEDVAGSVPDAYPVYAVVGEPGTDPDAAALYPGWDYGDADDLGWLLGRYPDLAGAVGEFGAGSLAGPDPAEPAGFDRAKHDANVPGDDVAASQTYQAEVVRTVAESLRTRGTRVVVANALRDAGDAGMGVYARDGDPKEAAGALAAAYRPVAPYLTSPRPGDSGVVVVNDSPGELTGALSYRAGERSVETEVTVGALERPTVETVTVPADADSVELLLAVGDDEVRTAYHL